MGYRNLTIGMKEKLGMVRANQIAEAITDEYYPNEIEEGMTKQFAPAFLTYVSKAYGIDMDKWKSSPVKEIMKPNSKVERFGVIYDATYEVLLDEGNENGKNLKQVYFSAPALNIPFVKKAGRFRLQITASQCPIPEFRTYSRMINAREHDVNRLRSNLISHLQLAGTLENFLKKFPDFGPVIGKITGHHDDDDLPVVVSMDELEAL